MTLGRAEINEYVTLEKLFWGPPPYKHSLIFDIKQNMT